MNSCHSPLLTGRLARACGGQQHVVARSLAVEGEAASVMSGRHDAFGALDPLHRGKRRNFTRDPFFGGPHGGAERVLREEVLEVGEQQFLMLLFVVDTKLDKRQRARRKIGQRGLDRSIDMRAPDAHLFERRPRQQPAVRTRVTRPFGFIIAVEEEGIAFVEQAVARHMVAQDEGFEKPCRVRKMPFGRRRVGHRLRAGVRIGERCDQIER